MGRKNRIVIASVILLILIALLVGLMLGTDLITNNGISREEDSKIKPSHPTNVTVQLLEDKILLKWLGTGDDRIQYYQIYQQEFDKSWLLVERIEVVGDNRDMYELVINNIEPGISYVFGVSAINSYQHESTISPSIPVSIP